MARQTLSPQTIWSRLGPDHGAVAVISAVMITAICGFAAISVDVGSLLLARRHLQAATDASALAATYGLAQNPLATTNTYAKNYLGYNGYPASRLTGNPVVTTGRYCPSVATSPPTPGSRFTPTSSPTSVCPGDPGGFLFGIGPNAVQVTATTTSPIYFGRVLLPGTTDAPITTTATATQIDEAGFDAATGLLSLNMGLVNAVLSGLLGTNISLDLVSYQGMVNTQINALSFMNALATQLNITAGTHNSVLQSSATVNDVFAAELAVLNQPNGIVNLGADVAAAKTGIETLQAGIAGNPKIQLSKLLDVGVWQNQGIGSTNPASALSAGLNVYDLASLTAQVANGSNALAIPQANIGIPGIANVGAALTAIEPPQSPPFAFGPVGVTVHTAQVRLQMSLKVLQFLSVLGGTAPVTLPLYVEVASGNAQLTQISCGLNPSTDATVTINGQSSVASAYVGTVSPRTPISNFTQPVTVQPASLVNIRLAGLLGIVNVTGSAEVNVGAPAPTPLTFNQTDIANATAQTVTSTDMLSNLLQTLDNTLVLKPTLLSIPLGGGTATTLDTALNTLLQPVFAGLDPLVDGLLAALGIKLGYMDVTATGVRCGVPALVL